MQYKPELNLDEFVKANAPYLTMADMAYETGRTHAEIGLLCDKLGIAPVTKGEQTRNLVREMADRMTIEEFAKKFGFSAPAIYAICRGLGIKMLEGEKKKRGPKSKVEPVEERPVAKPRKTVAQRLATVKRDEGYGYDHFDPNLELYHFVFSRDL